jgi:hypothetical protein
VSLSIKDGPGALEKVLGEYVVDHEADARRFFDGIKNMKVGT